jgi:dsDNA-specific endonuclease/ATPase MutS2
VLVGGLKVRLPFDRIKPLAKTPTSPTVKVHIEEAIDQDAVSFQRIPKAVDIRGMDLESALAKVDREISRALVQGQASIKVLHGLGVLRKNLRETLKKNHEAIANVRPGLDFEGGEAFSVIELR